jgi:hypothetical protein
MASGEFTVKLELSPFASYTLRALTAELCALRDELERVDPADVERLAKAVDSCLKRIDVLGGMFAHRTDG